MMTTTKGKQKNVSEEKGIFKRLNDFPFGLPKYSLTYRIKKRIREWRKGPDNLMLINMELRNGDHQTFTVPTRNRGFDFLGSTYLFDDSLKYFNKTAQIWCLDYHQDFTLPIQRRVLINDVRKTLQESGISEVELATNPSTLQNFIDSRIVSEILTSGAQVEAFFMSVKKLLFAVLIIVLIHAVLFLVQSGLLDRFVKG